MSTKKTIHAVLSSGLLSVFFIVPSLDLQAQDPQWGPTLELLVKQINTQNRLLTWSLNAQGYCWELDGDVVFDFFGTTQATFE